MLVTDYKIYPKSFDFLLKELHIYNSFKNKLSCKCHAGFRVSMAPKINMGVQPRVSCKPPPPAKSQAPSLSHELPKASRRFTAALPCSAVYFLHSPAEPWAADKTEKHP